MNRHDLQSLADFIRERSTEIDLRLRICYSTPCISSGAPAVKRAMEDALHEVGASAPVTISRTGCMGPCSRGPLVAVERRGKDDIVYENVTPETARQIVLDLTASAEPPGAGRMAADDPFFAGQLRIVLENSGYIDPERIDDYIGRGGYAALSHALHDMSPDEVCDAMQKSGLRGRGGGGYPTGLKWQLVRKSPGERKFVVANGDEGDPGAYMDRTLMESDPHRILEGMAIAGYATGAEQGYIYVRGEYPVAADRLKKAIKAAEKNGLLGSRILESNVNFRIDLRIGAGAFVCGEETALMASIMGRRGQPVPRPPYPAQKGLWGHPTLLNNVETFGSVPAIIRENDDTFISTGTEKSRGTKIFALCGEIVNSGLIEVPMGITLRQIVETIGGGMSDGRTFKTAQTGGPSGGCIPAEHLDTPVDYESLAALGSIMGSGGLIVMSQHSCMVDVAKFFMEFSLDESCGKCAPCRTGTVHIHRILKRITDGAATGADLEQLESLCAMVRDTSLCGLGATAPNPVLNTMKYFRDEYLAHIDHRHCPAGVCRLDDVPITAMADELPKRIRAGRPDGEVS